ncbi:MAG: hypothetical protein N4A63_09270 [Vallitalea sp.]|jgi:hypothetical protein|nr:hypothetical protein [Vallitalea sp.]
MKLNKKMLNIPIILMLVITVLCLLNIPSRINMLNEIAGIDKLGFIKLDKEGLKYKDQEEIFVVDKQTLYKFINTINNGKINTDIKLDKQPADYQLNFYKKDKVIKGFYWNKEKYNFNIESVKGEISVNHKLGELIKEVLY